MSRFSRAWLEHEDLAELRLDLTELTYLSSAGLRSLVVAHQRLGREVGIVLTGVCSDVAESIRLTSFDAAALLEEPDRRPSIRRQVQHQDVEEIEGA